MRNRQKLLLTVAVLAASSVRAWAAECPLGAATLQGTYLHRFHGNGYLIGPQVSLPSASGALFVAAGRTIFDGAGQLVWRDSASLGGFLLLDREVPAQYEIDADTCLGVISSPGFGEIARIIASPDGREMLFINSFQGTAVTGIFRRVPSGACSDASFNGSYRSLVEGSVYRPGSTLYSNGPSLAFAGVGRIVLTTNATGSGTFEWTSTDSTAGKIEKRTLRGTHQLDSAGCRAFAQVNQECVNGSCRSIPAGASTARLTASPEGDEVVYVNTTTNVSVAGRMTRQ